MSYKKKKISLFLLIACIFVPAKPVNFSWQNIASLGTKFCTEIYFMLDACIQGSKKYLPKEIWEEIQKRRLGIQQLQAIRIPLPQQIHQQQPLPQKHKGAVYQRLFNYWI